MEVAETLSNIEKIDKSILKLQKERSVLFQSLKTAGSDDWDWITVKQACAITGLSPATIYARINNGLLTTKHIGAKVLISKNQLFRTDDNYRQSALADVSIKHK